MRSPRWPALLAAIALMALVGMPGCGKHPATAPKAPSKTAPKAPSKVPKDKYAGLTAVQVFDIAVAQSRKRSYATARDTLQKVLSRTDATPDLIAKVHLELANAYFYDGGILNLAEAQSRYTNFLTFYPNHDRADYAQYQLGLCYLKQVASPDRDQEQTRKALNELVKVRNIYPNSEYVGAADEKANEAREILAEHDFRIGYFYFRRRSYTGAVERFRSVLESYPGYSRKDRLYLMLGQSLLAMNKRDEGRIYLEKLVAEFPKSRYTQEARDILKQPPPATASGH